MKSVSTFLRRNFSKEKFLLYYCISNFFFPVECHPNAKVFHCSLAFFTQLIFSTFIRWVSFISSYQAHIPLNLLGLMHWLSSIFPFLPQSYLESFIIFTISSSFRPPLIFYYLFYLILQIHPLLHNIEEQEHCLRYLLNHSTFCIYLVGQLAKCQLQKRDIVLFVT